MGSFGNNQNAVIYCRVSSKKQVLDGHGLEGQEKSCRDYARANGFKVIKVFRDEGVSGALTDRPSMRNLLAYLDKRKERCVVIIDDINRLARDVVGHFQLKAMLDDRQAILKSPSLEFEDTPYGKFIEQLYASVAELERNTNQERVLNRMKSRLELGYWVFNNPVGYCFIKDQIHGQLLSPDVRNADLIKQAFTKFASNELVTQQDVGHFLAERNLCNSKGKTMSLCSQGIKRILRNSIYAGFIEYKKWNIKRRDGHHEPIISKEIFHQVTTKLRSKRKVHKTNQGYMFPLRGLLKCSCCGNKLTGSYSGGRNAKYPYYRCSSNKQTCNIKPKNISRDTVENDFLNLLNKIRIKPSVLRLARRITTEVYNEKLDVNEELAESHRKDIIYLEGQIDDVVTKITQCNNRTVINRLEIQVENLESEILQKEELINLKMSNSVEPSKIFDNVSELLSTPSKFWLESNYQKRLLIQNLIFTDLIQYSKESGFGTVNFSLPFSMLQEDDNTNNNLVGFIHFTQYFYKSVIPVFRISLAIVKTVNIDTGHVKIRASIDHPLCQ